MHLEEIRNHCLGKKGVTEEFPFDEQTLVFKVMGKMFALADVGWEEKSINLKCDPEYSVDLRERYPEVQPGYHMNKKHWNTVYCDGALDDRFLLSLIDDSYALVVKSLPKKVQADLGQPE